MITPGAIKVAPPIKNSSRLQLTIGLPSPSKPMFEIIILIRNQMLFNQSTDHHTYRVVQQKAVLFLCQFLIYQFLRCPAINKYEAIHQNVC